MNFKIARRNSMSSVVENTLAASTRIENVQVDVDEEFTYQWLHRQKYAWGAVVLRLVAAVAGLLGSGPSNRRNLHAAPLGPRLEYEKLLRHKTASQMKIWIPPHSERETVHVSLRGDAAIEFRPQMWFRYLATILLSPMGPLSM
jgi:hypothetical protein